MRRKKTHRSCCAIVFVKRRNLTILLNGIFCPTSDSAGTTNACSSNNGGCPHLCLPKPDNKKTCACTTGFIPSHDGTRCEQYESFAIISSSEFIRGFHINSSDHSEAMPPITGSKLGFFLTVRCLKLPSHHPWQCAFKRPLLAKSLFKHA